MSSEKRVLVIEDENALREVLRDNLQGAGFKVLEARDGKQGLDVARAEHPDIILLDILMPRINGMRVLHELRQDPWGKDVPVVLITNLSPNQKILEGVIKDKPVYYLEKSGWSIREVVEKVRTLAFAQEALAQSTPQ
jgi:CheY-like chemotaxis protein